MQEEILEKLKESGLFRELELSTHCHGEDDCLSVSYRSDDPVGEQRFVHELLKEYPHWRIDKIDVSGPLAIVTFHQRLGL